MVEVFGVVDREPSSFPNSRWKFPVLEAECGIGRSGHQASGNPAQAVTNSVLTTSKETSYLPLTQRWLNTVLPKFLHRHEYVPETPVSLGGLAK